MNTDDYKACLKALQAHPEFPRLLKVLKEGCPYVPEYSPGADPHTWAYRSGLKCGFLAALDIFGINND